MTVALYSTPVPLWWIFNPPKWCSCSSVWFLHGGCHSKLLPSRCVLSTRYKPHTIPRHFIQSHVHRVHACFAVTSHLQFGRMDVIFSHVAVVTQGWNRYRNKSWHKKLTLKIFYLSHCSCWDSNPRPFNHESGALTTELSLLPFWPSLKVSLGKPVSTTHVQQACRRWSWRWKQKCQRGKHQCQRRTEIPRLHQTQS